MSPTKKQTTKKPHPRRSYEQSADEPIAITPIEYSGLQEAFDHFGRVLFGGKLPDVFITYQRKAHSSGYFSAERFSGRSVDIIKHELALNPDDFIGKTDKQICQTLVHEMTHCWQHAHGKPSKRGYHNQEWADKMKSIGLQPSSTGMVGGKETGQHMADYPITGGAFERAYEKLAATGWALNLQSAHRPGPKGTNNSKTKFTCPQCGLNAWAKPGAHLTCTNCRVQMRDANQSYDAKPERKTKLPDFTALTARAKQLGHALEGSWRGVDGGTAAFENACERCGEMFVLFWGEDGKPICVIEPCAERPVKKRGRPKGSKNKPKHTAVRTIKQNGKADDDKVLQHMRSAAHVRRYQISIGCPVNEDTEAFVNSGDYVEPEWSKERKAQYKRLWSSLSPADQQVLTTWRAKYFGPKEKRT